MKRVLQISNYLYPNRGGIEQVARDIANALQGQYEQKIICFNETASDGEYACNRKETIKDKVDGVEVIRCGCITKKASQSISLTFGRQLKKVMKDFRPDIVIFHYPNPFQAFFLKKYLDKDFRFILYWHLDITKQKTLRKLFNKQTIRLLERTDTIVATSPVYIDGSPYLSKYKQKCTVIPNCISAERLRITDDIKKKAEQIKNEYRDRILCFAIGRHIPYKGFTQLIQAAKYLNQKYHIVIAGKGPMTKQLKREAQGDSRISFVGRVSDDDLTAYYYAMDVFCFPSITKNEAFGIALAEAMFFGKPAVTFTIPGSGVNFVNMKDITGLEVPNGDSKSFAAAICALGEDYDKRVKMGLAAQERVNKLFTFPVFKRNILHVILYENSKGEYEK